MPCTTCSTEARCDDSGTCLDFAQRMYADRLRSLVESAARDGFVLTIEQRALRPLAMGHYESVVSVRPARKGA